jgi:queuine/archaeosine tRNA-ribosyltransferase
MGRLVNFCAGINLHVLPGKYVDAILINVPDNASSDDAIKSTKRILKAAKTRFTMLDSGGFQLHMGEHDSKKISFDKNRPVICNKTEINLAPVHVMAAASILKPDIVVGQDFPIMQIPDPDGQKLEFMRKLGFNVIWSIECSELRKKLCPDIQFFVPVQCYDLYQFDQFISMITGAEYDGFSMPIRNLSNSEIILFMIRFYQMGIRQVHLLGTSKLFAVAIAAYMARHLFEWVSFDAKTWLDFAKFFRYMNPHDLSADQITLDTPIDCECPFCRGKTFAFIKNMPDTEVRALLRNHNWWVLEKATQDLYKNSGSVIELKRCLQARGAKSEDIYELRKALSLADSLKNKDIRVLQDQLK